MLNYLDGVESINIQYTDLTNLLNRSTGNLLAENEIPDMLREALRRGIDVRVFGPASTGEFRLVAKGDKFNLEPMNRKPHG